jgi:hypothetical protein
MCNTNEIELGLNWVGFKLFVKMIENEGFRNPKNQRLHEKEKKLELGPKVPFELNN